eukprot:scaffold23214_cov40-Prasinocladus_malaysianus.AAC.1
MDRGRNGVRKLSGEGTVVLTVADTGGCGVPRSSAGDGPAVKCWHGPHLTTLMCMLKIEDS